MLQTHAAIALPHLFGLGLHPGDGFIPLPLARQCSVGFGHQRLASLPGQKVR
jgi:hypothetical protein